jgi:glyoxylate utilization-related uncharacterized protein
VDAQDAEQLTFLGRPVGPSFRAHVVTIAPGGVRPYDEGEWRDALVVVECGSVAVQYACGARTFATGDMLWLAGAGVLALRNEGPGSAILVAVSRRRSSG